MPGRGNSTCCDTERIGRTRKRPLWLRNSSKAECAETGGGQATRDHTGEFVFVLRVTGTNEGYEVGKSGWQQHDKICV